MSYDIEHITVFRDPTRPDFHWRSVRVFNSAFRTIDEALDNMKWRHQWSAEDAKWNPDFQHEIENVTPTSITVSEVEPHTGLHISRSYRVIDENGRSV